MTCKRGAMCDCSSGHTPLRMFCEDWVEPERPVDAPHKRSIENWATVPVEQRDRCIAELTRFMAGAPDVVEHWREQSRRGMVIGSDKLRFHLDEGMQIRNVLRRALPDTALPSLRQSTGLYSQNWDDFYMGALEALVQGHCAP